MKKLILLFCAACISCEGANFVQHENTHVLNEMVEKAKIAEQQGNVALAADFYKHAYEIRKDKEITLAYAKTLRATGNVDKASELYNKVLSENPDSVEALEGLALSQLAKGDFNNAALGFEKVIRKDATKWRSINGLGVISALRNNQKAAADYFNTALMISENNAAVLNNLALSKAFAGDYKGGMQALSPIASKLPEGVEKEQIEMNLSLLHGISGDLKKSEQLMMKYLNKQQIDNNLGFYARLSKNSVEAKEYFKKALSGGSYDKAEKNLELLKSDQVKAEQPKPAPAAPQHQEIKRSFPDKPVTVTKPKISDQPKSMRH